MSNKVTVIFVKGDDKDSLVDRVIDDVSHGIYSHVAVKISGSVIEALGEKEDSDPYPGVWKRRLDKYDNRDDVKMIDIDLPNIAGAESKAMRLIGTLYGYDDCEIAGIHDLTGYNIPDDGELTANCSKTVTLILRAGGLNVLSGIPADDITPNDLYRALEAMADAG